MYPAERQREIIRLAQQDDRHTVAVARLAADLDVAPETVRRDLSVLERQGLLIRQHGGATLVARAPFESPIQLRNHQERSQKEAIAQKVVSLLPQDGVILLDSGSLNYVIAEHLPNREHIVVTNNIPAVPLLHAKKHLSVIVLPGRVRPLTQASVDTWSAEALAGRHIDVAVIGANGVSVEAGATTTQPEEAHVKTSMLRSARLRILAVTAQKWGRSSFCRFAEMEDFDVVVTDSRIEKDLAGRISAAGPTLAVA